MDMAGSNYPPPGWNKHFDCTDAADGADAANHQCRPCPSDGVGRRQRSRSRARPKQRYSGSMTQGAPRLRISSSTLLLMFQTSSQCQMLRPAAAGSYGGIWMRAAASRPWLAASLTLVQRLQDCPTSVVGLLFSMQIQASGLPLLRRLIGCGRPIKRSVGCFRG